MIGATIEVIFGARNCAFNSAIYLDLIPMRSLLVWRLFLDSVIATASPLCGLPQMRVGVLEFTLFEGFSLGYLYSSHLLRSPNLDRPLQNPARFQQVMSPGFAPVITAE
jgi:hypothetical protein